MKTYTEAEVTELCKQAHWWGWVCRERLDMMGKFPVPIPFPPDLDYEEKEDFCFEYWNKSIRETDNNAT